MRAIVASVLVLLLSTPAVTADRKTSFWTEADSSWNKAAGNFRVRLAVSTEARAFIAAWEDESRTEPPALRQSSSVTIIPREVEFGAFVLFSNCPATDGKCSARVTYQIVSPEGKVLVEQPDLPLWTWTLPKKDTVQLSAAVWYTSAEASDPAGDYRVRAVIVDKASGTRLTLERIIRHT